MSDEIAFDPHDPTFVDVGVPFDVLARIRREQPVFRTPGGAHYLSRYADVEAALQDGDVFWAELGPITGIPAGVATIPADQHSTPPSARTGSRPSRARSRPSAIASSTPSWPRRWPTCTTATPPPSPPSPWPT